MIHENQSIKFGDEWYLCTVNDVEELTNGKLLGWVKLPYEMSGMPRTFVFKYDLSPSNRWYTHARPDFQK